MEENPYLVIEISDSEKLIFDFSQLRDTGVVHQMRVKTHLFDWSGGRVLLELFV